MNRMLREANALSKCLFAASLCAYAFVCSDWRVLVAYILLLMAILAMTMEFDRILLLALGILVTGLPVLLVLFIAGGIEKAPTWQEGVWLGLSWLGVFFLRIFIVVLADVLVVKLTSFSNMIFSLRSLRLPGRLVLFVSALVSMLPNIFGMALRVIEVQRCRGFEVKKLCNPKNFLPLFIPVFLAQMRRSADLALSLELRGVNGATYGQGGSIHMGRGDILFMAAAFLLWLGPFRWSLILQ